MEVKLGKYSSSPCGDNAIQSNTLVKISYFSEMKIYSPSLHIFVIYSNQTCLKSKIQ